MKELNVAQNMTLSQSQEEFFKNSKIRNEESLLIPVYHGSGTHITQFSPEYTGQGNDQYGSGFYFTTSAELAKGYTTARIRGENGTWLEKLGGEDEPNVISAYINLENPIVIDGQENDNLSHICLTAEQSYEIVKRLPSMYHPIGSDDIEPNPLEDCFEVLWEVELETKEAFEPYIEQYASEFLSDADLRKLDMLFAKYPTEFRNAIRDVLGYDGVIVNFKEKTHVIAWFPEQIKDIRNREPKYTPFLMDDNGGTVQTTSEKQRLFVDMDGTLAAFRPVDEIEVLYEEGYFLNLEPHENVVDAIREIITNHPEIEVNILSAYLADSQFALQEKNEWLDRYLPEISHEHRIFIPCGSEKKEAIRDGIRSNDFLLDDYTHNLNSWQPPARGIKLLNAINHTRGSWEYDRIRYDREPVELAKGILDVMRNERQIFDEKINDTVSEQYGDEAASVIVDEKGNPIHDDVHNGFDDYKEHLDYEFQLENGQQSDFNIASAKSLPDGWEWHMWNDGSGGLYSPNGLIAFQYDFATSEYRYSGEEWNFFDEYTPEMASFKGMMENVERRINARLETKEAELERKPLEEYAKEIAELRSNQPAPETDRVKTILNTLENNKEMGDKNER